MAPVEGRDYLACGYCHTFRFPTELANSADRITPLSEQAECECPVCRQQLVQGALDKARMMYCEKCRGVLVQNEAFAVVVQNRRREYTGADASPVPIDTQQYERRLDCPRCNGRMEVHPYHGPGCVVIDSCAACHLIWLDPGELAAIEQAPGQRKAVAAPAAPAIRPIASEQTPTQPEVSLLDLWFE